MKKKVMTKLEAYKQSKNDLEFAITELEKLKDESREIGTIVVSNSLVITHRSNLRQFLFGIGVVKSNLDACKELGEDPTDLKENLKLIKRLFQLGKEISQWQEYAEELDIYHDTVERLLTDDDKFALLEYPSKK
jgi:hypothetical protein